MSTPRFIADLHMGHKNIWKYRPVFESTLHNDLYFQNVLSEVCKNRDTLFILGDAVFDEKYLPFFKELPGTKILILGNHCISNETEVLTYDGWKKSTDINYTDMVATVNLTTNKLIYKNPENINIHHNMDMVNINGSFINEYVSNGHNIVYNNKLTPVNTLFGEHESNNFLYSSYDMSNGIDLSDDWIYLLNFVIADGSLVQGETKNKKRIQFKISKEQKLLCLENHLTKMNIPYTKRPCKRSSNNILQPYYIRIYGDSAREIWNHLNGSKTPPKLWRMMNRKQLLTWIKSIEDSDGYKEVHNTYITTIDKNFVDVFQHCCVTNGFACKFDTYIPTSGFNNGKLQYKIVFKTINDVNSTKMVEITESENVETVVSIQMEYGTLITRLNGKVSVTGNCTEYISTSKLCEVFDEVHGLLKYKEFWLSHAPLHPDELRGKKNVHGHVHTESVNDLNYLNVSVDSSFMNFFPRTLHEIRQGFETVNNEQKIFAGVPTEDALSVIESNPIAKSAYYKALEESRKFTV